jgi:class 3 adenylate cyclase
MNEDKRKKCRNSIQMPAFISMKKSLVFFLSGIICAAGMAFLVNFLLSGPKLGPVYDFLMDFRPIPPVSQEILIINTDEFAESGDIFSALMTLTEMEASNLFLTARVLGTTPITGTESEIRRQFYDEYALLGSNIRNLFEAIRTGSVQPAQAPNYVNRLVELNEQSRERLLSVLIDRDENLLRSIAVFGNYLEIDTKPVYDWDGKLRRVKPLDTGASFEHPVFGSLRNRYAVTRITYTEYGKTLVLLDYNNNELEILLDEDGNIITPGQGDFRSIDISLFREYEEACRSMRRVMKEAGDLGAFSRTLPEKSPLFLEDYALTLREELLKAPDGEKRAAWVRARENYFKNLDDFLYGNAESLIVRGYEEVIADEKTLKQEGISKLVNMRDEIIRTFAAMRVSHSELLRVHKQLTDELYSSICIMGPQDNTAYSALLANALITGGHIKPAYYLYTLYLTIAVSIFILLIIFRIRPFLLLFIGFILSAFAAFIFGGHFVYTAYWIDPTVVFISSLSGTLVIFFCKRATLSRRARYFRRAYGAAVSRNVLRELISRGKPNITETSVTSAAIIVIRDFNLLNREDYEKSGEAGKAQKTYYETVKKIVFKAGAVIAGFHGDTVIACFGSPLDYVSEPIVRAYIMVKQMLSSDKNSWRFGIDAGKCTFSWSPETGFTVNGRPVGRAKILASKNARFETRALVTEVIRESTNLNVKKIGTLRDEYDAFYEMTADIPGQSL